MQRFQAIRIRYSTCAPQRTLVFDSFIVLFSTSKLGTQTTGSQGFPSKCWQVQDDVYVVIIPWHGAVPVRDQARPGSTAEASLRA